MLQDTGSSHQKPSIRVLSLNCWGLKYISAYRHERLGEIGRRIATSFPAQDIVGLQECWTEADYASIRDQTRGILPYGKFYYSGIFGGGLVILSRWPIEESAVYRYPLNGRPTAFFRGDWFVGKGVACARIRMPGYTSSATSDREGNAQMIEVFNTHLHAPYESEPNDSYICHRTAQAWEIAKLMRHASERGSLVIGLGDFNMVPLSFAHMLIESRGSVKDVWRVLRPHSSIGASHDSLERDRRKRLNLSAAPTVQESVFEHGHTCDSALNTWRWSETQQKDLRKGEETRIMDDANDPRAKRLDYIFFGGLERGWTVAEARVTMTERHPELKCSLSDHFAVEATIVEDDGSQMTLNRLTNGNGVAVGTTVESLGTEEIEEKDIERAASAPKVPARLEASLYEEVLKMVHTYTLRERRQRRLRLGHFLASSAISIACFVAIWWSRSNYVSFILILLSSLGLMAGTVDGLIGGLFVGSELRALKEFEWEVRNAIELSGGQTNAFEAVRDWYD